MPWKQVKIMIMMMWLSEFKFNLFQKQAILNAKKKFINWPLQLGIPKIQSCRNSSVGLEQRKRIIWIFHYLKLHVQQIYNKDKESVDVQFIFNITVIFLSFLLWLQLELFLYFFLSFIPSLFGFCIPNWNPSYANPVKIRPTLSLPNDRTMIHMVALIMIFFLYFFISNFHWKFEFYFEWFDLKFINLYDQF